MNVERITIDTNILIYAMDADAGKKHSLAIKIIESAIDCDCLLTLQALSEFYHSITRKNKLSNQIALERVNDFMQLFPVIHAKQLTLKHAMNAVRDHSLSFWDAMLWSTAHDAGVTILLSEDFQHERILGNVRIVNPFIPNEYWSVS
ncbi:MAG: PIN domain-containing protein [Gammaproteobacteria bacterium]